MPWEESKVMDRRVEFIQQWMSGRYTKVWLCDRYGISRPTADKWVGRFEEYGKQGLLDRSRAPRRSPQSTPEELVSRLIKAKLERPHWGPKKVVDWLKRQQPEAAWPADSTVGEILKRAGLVKPRRRRYRVSAYPKRFVPVDQCNASWSADFKGDFQMGNGRRCYPLTITDNYSRYLLQCRALESTRFLAVKPWFEEVFRDYGLPVAIRTDNGTPFASVALGGLSHLARWWIQLGITPERTRPAKPSQNGRHERMHRTLKDEATKPPNYSCQTQQQRFDDFIYEYNFERSHESLERQPPAHVHQRSTRPYPSRLPPIEYEQSIDVRSVRHNGEIKWNGKLIYLTQVLSKDRVGLRQVDEDRWEILYSFVLLGHYNQRTGAVESMKQWHKDETKT